MKAPVTVMQGVKCKQVGTDEDQANSLGRGVGFMTLSAVVEVVPNPTGGKQVVASMQVPKHMENFPDEELVRRFINGFGGPSALPQ